MARYANENRKLNQSGVTGNEKHNFGGGKKVAVGLSGGVDSAVAAYLLKEDGFDVTGVYMKCWDTGGEGCEPDPDKASAVQVASHLDIKFKELDFQKQYKERVINYFYSEYKAGRTPNPDVMCNKEIKFGLFFDWAMENGFDYVATGHYARIRKIPKTQGEPEYLLLKGIDNHKDQSYFLYILEQQHLEKTMFPLGEYTKEWVRNKAREISLNNADRPDSTGICFIGEVDIKEFLKKEIKPKKGDVLNLKGEKIGEHEGVWYYTIGQRHGFTISKYSGNPLYVVKKDVSNNSLIVSSKKDVLTKEFQIHSPHWINKAPMFPIKVEVRVRHLGELYTCVIDKSSGADTVDIKLEKPIFAVASGQSAVLYDEDKALGGGIIV